MIVSGKPNNVKDMRAKFMQISRQTGIDISFHVENIYSGNRKLVAFDMDSTLIDAEVIDELAIEAGVGEQVAAITEAAMRGEVDFKESLKHRLALPEGVRRFVFPAMNTNMLNHIATCRNISIIARDGVAVADTREAMLACGDEGKGAVLKPRDAVKWFNEKVKL